MTPNLTEQISKEKIEEEKTNQFEIKNVKKCYLSVSRDLNVDSETRWNIVKAQVKVNLNKR